MVCADRYLTVVETLYRRLLEQFELSRLETPSVAPTKSIALAVDVKDHERFLAMKSVVQLHQHSVHLC